MSHKWIIIILLALSVAVHFAFFGHPNETVFDEVHFGKFVSGYYTGEYYFDIHPPLGKLIIAGFAKVVDFKPAPPAGEAGYNFTEIGKEFPDKKYLALRFLPAVAGALLPVIIYLLALELGLSRMASFTGGLLLVFENSLLTQSRLMLLDPFLLLFGFTSLLFYFKSRHLLLANRYWLLTAVFAALAASIKFTGLSFIALPLVLELRIMNYELWKILKIAFFFLVIPLIIYFSIFVLHFVLLPKSGPGDAFMSPSFRKTLIGNNYQNDANVRPANIVSKFIELNREMYRSNQRLTATHPYSSQWYSWPLMARPIYYWVKDNARVYFFGNPVVWWSSAVAVILLLLRNLQFSKPTLRSAPRPLRVGVYNFQLKTGHILLGGYFLNLLPFIGVKRVMFLYHYLTALIFAVLMLVYLLDKTKNAKRNFGILITGAIITFLFFAPLSYGLPLSDKAYEAKIWFASWR